VPSSASPSVPRETGAGPSGWLLTHYLLALLVLCGLGIATVWQHTRAVRAGYRLGALERQREALREEERKLDLERARESRLDVLMERARRLDVRIPGEDPEVYQLLR